MTANEQLAKKLTAEHESYLESAGDGLVQAILEGVKEGVAEGLEKGARDALKECLTQGFINVEAPAIKDILKDIPREMVKSSVKEGAKRIFKKSTEGYIKKACQKLIKKMQKEGIKPSREETDYILKIFKKSEREALKKLAAKMPQNPLFGAIIAGMQSALEESLEKNFAAYAQKMQKAATPRTAKRRAKMAKNDELNKSVKSLVKKIVSKIVYKLVKASAKKAVAELKKKLKEEFIHKIEDKLKEAAEDQLEKQLTKSSQKLQKEIVQDNPKGSDHVSQMQQSFEKDFNNFLSSLKGISALKVAVISCICALVIGTGLYFGAFYDGGESIHDGGEPPPSPQPDLVITGLEPEWTGDSVIIHYTITNQGGGEAGGSYTCLKLGDNILMENYVGPLVPGETRMLSCPSCSLPEYDPDAAMEFCADDHGEVEENNEENNCASIDLPPPTTPPTPPAPQPDLVITDIFYDITVIGEIDGTTIYSVTCHYVIKNQGEAEAGKSYTSIEFFFDGTYWADEVMPLGPGEEREESFAPHTTEYENASKNILCVDIYGDVDESDEDNCASMTDL